jgi:hypothetical protein
MYINQIGQLKDWISKVYFLCELYCIVETELRLYIFLYDDYLENNTIYDIERSFENFDIFILYKILKKSATQCNQD